MISFLSTSIFSDHTIASSASSSPVLHLFMGFPFTPSNNNLSSVCASSEKWLHALAPFLRLGVAILLSSGQWHLRRSVIGSFWELSLRDIWHFTCTPFHWSFLLFLLAGIWVLQMNMGQPNWTITRPWIWKAPENGTRRKCPEYPTAQNAVLVENRPPADLLVRHRFLCYLIHYYFGYLSV